MKDNDANGPEVSRLGRMSRFHKKNLRAFLSDIKVFSRIQSNLGKRNQVYCWCGGLTEEITIARIPN